MRYLFLFVFMAFAATSVSAQSLTTIYLAGDSTMAEKLPEKRPETGWGEMLGKHFKTGRVKIENRAANGRSTKTFISEARWLSIMKDLKKGDYVFIQFGHNDQSKEKGERYTPPYDFKKNLAQFIDDVKSKGATPVLMTPVARRRFDKDGKFYDSHGEYPGLTRTVAIEKKVTLIDMQKKSESVIIKYGVDESRKLFLQLKAGENVNYPNGIEDNTHFSPLGADEIAKLAVQGIKEAKLPLRRSLK